MRKTPPAPANAVQVASDLKGMAASSATATAGYAGDLRHIT
ncbi:hypothetical protein [Arthrobacter sp. StoSoilA2]|nr:hypothetical protein [Arthrobacter sp. StoSoilA2]